MPSPRRFHKVAQAIHRRQVDLIVALDQVHDPHNLSAVLRSADAVGLAEVLWQPDNDDPDPPDPEVAKGAERWVMVRQTPDLSGEIRRLKKDGFRVAATHLGSKAVDFRSIDWTGPWVLVVGNEKRGCSETILGMADENVVLPMMGLVQSLNVSVASAVLFYEILRQREAAGLYAGTRPRTQVERLYKQWGLQGDGFVLEDLLEAPDGAPPSAPEHFDSRKKGFGSRRSKA